MATWIDGPRPKDHFERLNLTHEITQRVQTRFNAIAVGVYGSIARGQDRPFSDIEILAIVPDGPDEDWEWLHNGWSIEVNVREREPLLRYAMTVGGDWAITHSNYLRVMPIYDPTKFFVELAAAIENTPQVAFEQAIKELMMHLYGATSKLRNAQACGEPPPPGFVYYLVKLGYWMIGLANRHTYSTATLAIRESLTLQDRPPGYDALCQMSITGDIGDHQQVFDACEVFWHGAAEWACARGLNLESPKHLL